MNQRSTVLKTFLASLTLSAAFVTLPVHVHASELLASYKSPEDTKETLCTHFHLRRNAQPIFDDPSNQGENVVQLYELMLTGFSLLEDYKRTGDFSPFVGSRFEAFFTPRLKDLTFRQYIDNMSKDSFSDFCESLDGRMTIHADGLDFLQSLRSIIVSLKAGSKIEDCQIARYFLFKSYLSQPATDKLFGIFLLPEDSPCYLSIHAGIQWFDNQVIQSLFRHGSRSIHKIGDEIKGQINISNDVLRSNFPLIPINYVGVPKESGIFYFSYQPQYVSTSSIDGTGNVYTHIIKNKLNMTMQSPHYLGFIRTELEFCDTGNPETVRSGLILDKDGNVLLQNNLFFASRDGKLYKNKYFYDSVLGQYIFHEFDISSLTDNVSPYERLLIKLAGGIEGIQQRNLIAFDEIIQEHEGGSQEEVAFFLGCLKCLQAEPDSSPAYRELVSKFENRLLTYYDTTLSTVEVARITNELQTQFAAETDLLVDDALERYNPEIIQEINDYYAEKGITKVIAVPKPASKGGTAGKKGKKTEARKPISIAKKDLLDFKQKKATKSVETRLEAEIQEKQQKKRTDALARLRREVLSDLNGLKHLSGSELNSILGGIREKVAELDVVETGKMAIRGSHQGREVASAGGSTKLSVARRSEKDGYSIGTVKTIVKDHFEKLSKIL